MSTTALPLPTHDEIAARLRAILRESLAISEEALERPFLEIGTSSLAMVEAFRRVSEAFGVRPSLRRIFESCGTVDRLADYVLELMAAPPVRAGVQKDVEYPLTPSQRTLCFLSSLQGGAALAWKETAAFYLEGRLQLHALKRALDKLTACHEVLRVRLDPGQDRLRVLAAAELSLEESDVSGLPQAEQQSRIRAWLRTEEETPLEVDQGALVRVRCLRISERLFAVAISAHALIADRPAIHRLIMDLGRLYGADLRGEEAALPEVPSYLRFHEALLKGGSDTAREYWLGQFRDGGRLFDLPADLVRPAVKTYRGARLVVPLQRQAFAALRGRDGGLAASLHVLSALAAFCARIGGATELTIGTFARAFEQAPPELVANATSTLPLRLHVDSEMPFSALAEHTRDRLREALQHLDFPFASLVGALNPTRDRGRSPIFTIAFDREVLPDAVPFGDLKLTPLVFPSSHARYDLLLTLVEGGGIFQLHCDYSTDLFEAATIRQWMDCFLHLLNESLRGPASSVAALPLVPSGQHQYLIEELNRTDRTYPTGKLHELFAAQARLSKEQVAVRHRDRSLTYDELERASNQIAHRLRALGVGAEDRVAVCMERTPEMIAALLGVLKAGAAYVPLDPSYPEARNTFTLEDSAAKVLLVDSTTAPAALSIPCVSLSPRFAELAEQPSTAPSAVADARLAYLIYTSGSTGKPKGVAIEHASAVNLVHWALETFSREDLAQTLVSTSICFDLSVFEIFVPLACGGTLILAKNAMELPELPAFAEVTLLNTVPSAASGLARQPGALPAGLRVISLCGEVMRGELAARLYAACPNARVYNLYGPSEGTTYSTVVVVPPSDPREPSIGRPIANNRCYVLDARNEPVPRGVPGELWVAGIGVARGYFGRPELTAERFADDPFRPGERMYRTGDLARYRADGELEFLGRLDHQVKVRGYRIELGEIEVALSAHPSVTEVVVVAREDEPGVARLIAYLAARSREDWTAYLAERLPSFMIPSIFVEVAALPRTPNGKVDRRALPAPEIKRPAESGYVPPRTALERTLAGSFSKALGVATIGVHDDFFTIGGHSLMLTSLLLDIHARLGIRLPLSVFFEAPTVAELARELAPRLESAPAPALPRRSGPEVKARFDALRADAELDPSFSAQGSTSAASAERIFFTGATGFVGAHLLAELLNRSSAHIDCLIRCRDEEAGRERILQALRKHGLLTPSIADRIGVVPGDMSTPGLGLSAANRARLAAEIDQIFHVGAMVNFIYPYRALRQSNVEGTREVVRLAFEKRLKPVHFVSSTAIWPMGRTGHFAENTDLDHDTRLNLGYDESKWTAERLLENARARGLPVSIYRPGEVSGHGRTGACVLDHFLFAILKGSLQIEAFPEIKCHIDMSPVDYVAAAIARISLDPRGLGKTYHVVHPEPCTADQFYEFNRARGYRFEVLPLDAWRARLFAHPRLAENALYPFTPILEEFQEENLQLPVFDSRNTRTALAGTDALPDPVYPNLLSTYYDYFQRIGFFSDPRAA